MMAQPDMRKPAVALARKAPSSADGRDRAPIEMVCLALTLAIFALACRIASIW
jgi:hypothetical protein